MVNLAELPYADPLGRPLAVLVFSIGSLGDTMAALPAFHEIRRQNPNARIVLLTNTPVDRSAKAASSTSLLEGSGLVDGWVEYPHGRLDVRALLRVIDRVRRTGARSGVYLMQRRSRAQVARDYVFLRACGIRHIAGMHWRPLLHRPRADVAGLWESEAARQLRSIGVEKSIRRLDFALNLSDGEKISVERKLRDAGIGGDYVVLCAGTKVSVKDWGEDRWGEFVDRLASAIEPRALVVIGSLDERGRGARLAQRWPWGCANLCGRLTPRESAVVLQRAQLFVGHDSGPMHLAAAAGTPTVAVFASRELPGIWFPFGQEKNVFYTNVSCRDCRLDECVEQRKRCILAIRPADVAQRATGLISTAAQVTSQN